MKVGDLVRAPHLIDHDPSAVGLLVEVGETIFKGHIDRVARVIWANKEGACNVFPHLLEVVSESR